jgi:hypothetical protein
MLNPIVTGDAIAAVVQAAAPPPGTAITPSQLKTMWEQIMTVIYADLAANAMVAPGTFLAGGIYPVAGIGGPIT